MIEECKSCQKFISITNPDGTLVGGSCSVRFGVEHVKMFDFAKECPCKLCIVKGACTVRCKILRDHLTILEKEGIKLISQKLNKYVKEIYEM